jgi:hypothetical protein
MPFVKNVPGVLQMFFSPKQLNKSGVLQTSFNNLGYFRYVFLYHLALGLSMDHQVDLKGDPQGHP